MGSGMKLKIPKGVRNNLHQRIIQTSLPPTVGLPHSVGPSADVLGGELRLLCPRDVVRLENNRSPPATQPPPALPTIQSRQLEAQEVWHGLAICSHGQTSQTAMQSICLRRMKFEP